MKQQIRLTESDLKNVIKTAVKNILKEYTDLEKRRIYGYTSDEDDFYDEDFNETPTNNLVGESQIKITETELKEIIKESVKGVLAEIDWRTVANAADLAGSQSMNDKLPQGLRRKRTDQWKKFKGDIRPRMMKQYDLSNDEVSDAIKGKGPFYNSASRKALRNMDKLNADYDKFHSGDRENHAKYENGKWQ